MDTTCSDSAGAILDTAFPYSAVLILGKRSCSAPHHGTESREHREGGATHYRGYQLWRPHDTVTIELFHTLVLYASCNARERGFIARQLVMSWVAIVVANIRSSI